MDRAFMSEKDFLEYVEGICKRPKMYTSMGSFYETVAFLEGFGSGANVEHCYHSAFTPFHNWMKEKFDTTETKMSWIDFRGRFSSDSEATEIFQFYIKNMLKV